MYWPRESIRPHRLRALSCRTTTTPTSDSPKPRFLLVLLTDQHSLEFPYSLGSINLLGQLSELRKLVYSLDYWFITEDVLREMNQQPDGEIKERGRSPTKELLSSQSLGLGMVVPGIIAASPSGSLWTLSYGFVWLLLWLGTFDEIIGHWWLIHPPSSFPFLEVRGMGLKVPKLFNNIVGFPGHQPSLGGYESHLLT